MAPTINAGQEGTQYTYIAKFIQNFDGTIPLSDTFTFNRMDDGLHRVGNGGQDENGNSSGGSANGLRWSGRYTNPEEVCYIENQGMVFANKLSNESNPTRKAFTHKGVTYRPDLVRIDGAFAVSWDRAWLNAINAHATAPESPNLTIGPNTYTEIRVDARDMKTPGARWSAYLLPANENDSNSYNEDGTLGNENDWPEIEVGGPEHGLNHDRFLQNKILSGRAGNSTPNGSVDVTQIIPGFSFRVGIHVYGILWLKNLIIWYVDGIEVQRETDPRRIALVAMYIVFSREYNTGALDPNQVASGNPENRLIADPPKLPVDPGIFLTNVYEYADTLNDDKCIVEYMHIYEVDDDGTLPEAGRGIGDGVSGIRPVITADQTSGNTRTFRWSISGRTINQWRLKVGSTRGAHDYYNPDVQHAAGYTSATSATVSGLPTDSSNVNVRLWFRENDDDVWDFQDIGYPQLSDYWRGTEGRIRVTTVEDIARTSPTVAGASYLGIRGTATPIDPNEPLVPVDPVDPSTPTQVVTPSSGSYVPQTGGGINFSQGLVSGVHTYELEDPAMAGTGQWEFDSYGDDATALTDDLTGSTLRLLVTEVNVDTPRTARYVIDDAPLPDPISLISSRVRETDGVVIGSAETSGVGDARMRHRIAGDTAWRTSGVSLGRMQHTIEWEFADSGITYEFQIVDPAGVWEGSVLTLTTAAAEQKPLPPSSLQGVQNNTQIALSWPAVLEADRYNIYKDDYYVTTTAELTWTDTSVVGGNRYEYAVRSVNSSNAQALQVSATAITVSVEFIGTTETVFPTLTSHSDGDTLPEGDVTFVFDFGGNTFEDVAIRLGSSVSTSTAEYGSIRTFAGDAMTNTLTSTNLPTNGSSVYLTADFKINGIYDPEYALVYQFTAWTDTTVTPSNGLWENDVPNGGLAIGITQTGVGIGNTNCATYHAQRVMCERTGLMTGWGHHNRMTTTYNLQNRTGTIYDNIRAAGYGNDIIRGGLMIGKGGYSMGNGGLQVCTLQGVNGAGEPDGNILAESNPWIPIDQPHQVIAPIPWKTPVQVYAGTLYHVVYTNLKPNGLYGIDSSGRHSASAAAAADPTYGSIALDGQHPGYAESLDYERFSKYGRNFTQAYLKYNVNDPWEVSGNFSSTGSRGPILAYTFIYSDGVEQGQSTLAYGQNSTGHHDVNGSDRARQTFRMAHRTRTVDRIVPIVYHGSGASGQPMSVTVKNSSGATLATASVLSKTEVRAQSNSPPSNIGFWTARGVGHVTQLSNNIDLVQGQEYTIEYSAVTNAKWVVINNIATLSQVDRNADDFRDGTAEVSANGGGSWTTVPNNRNLSMYFIPVGKPDQTPTNSPDI